MHRNPRIWLAVLLLASAMFHLQFVARTELDLFPDEAQYWDWSRLPDWSYYSKPPLVAYSILASRTALGENSPVAVRLPAVVCGTATTFFIYRLALLVSGSPAAGLAAAAAHRLAPLFISETVATTTDSLLLLFWTLTSIFLYRALLLGETRAWPGVGLALALGVLSKYTMLVALVTPLGFAWMVWRPERFRVHLKGALLALAMVMLAFVPLLVWNFQHDWASFRHVASNAGKPGHLGGGALATAGEFVASQLAVATPVLFVAIVWALWCCARRWREARSETDLFLLWGALPIFLLYVTVSLGGRAEANWAAPAYVAGLAAFARHIWLARRRLAVAALALAVPFTVLTYNFELVYSLGFHPRPRSDPTMRMRGWRELGLAVGGELQAMEAAAARQGAPEASATPFVLADSYQVTAVLAFYVPGQPRTYCASLGRRRCQYDYWPGFDRFVGRDAVYATEGDWPGPHHMLRRAFERFEKGPTVVYRFRGVPARKFSLFRLYGFRGMEPTGFETY